MPPSFVFALIGVTGACDVDGGVGVYGGEGGGDGDDRGVRTYFWDDGDGGMTVLPNMAAELETVHGVQNEGYGKSEENQSEKEDESQVAQHRSEPEGDPGGRGDCGDQHKHREGLDGIRADDPGADLRDLGEVGRRCGVGFQGAGGQCGPSGRDLHSAAVGEVRCGRVRETLGRAEGEVQGSRHREPDNIVRVDIDEEGIYEDSLKEDWELLKPMEIPDPDDEAVGLGGRCHDG